jgi:hypothetical protein
VKSKKDNLANCEMLLFRVLLRNFI